MDTYIPAYIVESQILPQCDSAYLSFLVESASRSGDHAFVLDTLYNTLQHKKNDIEFKMSYMTYIIKHFTYEKIKSVKKNLEILCFENNDVMVNEVLKHPDDRVLTLFCAPCSVCAGEIIPRAICLRLSYKIWEASFDVTPTLYDVLLMLQLEDKVGLETFFKRLKYNYSWIGLLRNDMSNYIDEMEEGVYTDEDATLGLLCNISHMLKRKHSNKDARWAYKKLKYFQKLLNISYFVESCEEYFIHIEDAIEDYDY